MNLSMPFQVAAAISAAEIATTALVLGGPPQYEVTTLTLPPNVTAVTGLSVNANGEVVGTCFNLATGYFDGVYWDAQGNGVVASQVFGLDTAEAIGICDNGLILAAVTEDANAQVPHGAVLVPGEGYTLLPSLAGNTGVASAAFDMNDAGVVAGRSALVATPFWLSVPNHAVIWVDGQVHDIGTLGGFWATARRINNNNVIIGESNTATSDFARGYVWTEASGMMEIPPLEPGQFGHVSDLNDSNVIVGRSSTSSGNLRAVIWEDFTALPAPLVLLPGDIGSSNARGINDAGHIVGSAGTDGTDTGARARLWLEGKVYDLNDLLVEPLSPPLATASAITNNGVILAFSVGPAGTITHVLRPASVSGDLDGDGSVGVPDLLLLLAAWGDCDACEDCPADLTGDCSVGVTDLLQLLSNWG